MVDLSNIEIHPPVSKQCALKKAEENRSKEEHHRSKIGYTNSPNPIAQNCYKMRRRNDIVQPQIHRTKSSQPAPHAERRNPAENPEGEPGLRDDDDDGNLSFLTHHQISSKSHIGDTMQSRTLTKIAKRKEQESICPVPTPTPTVKQARAHTHKQPRFKRRGRRKSERGSSINTCELRQGTTSGKQ